MVTWVASQKLVSSTASSTAMVSPEPPRNWAMIMVPKPSSAPTAVGKPFQ